MKSYLTQIAEKYYQNYGNRVSEMAFVFPNKRAGIFFNKALKEIANKPLFAPTILAINDLFFANSTLKPAKPITLKFALYKTYKTVVDSTQTFDTFVSWCDPLLKDFNDIDKYMIDAKQVLQNVRDLEELKNFDYLTDEQKAIIEQFWGHLCDKKGQFGDFERCFLDLWDKLPLLYEQFKADLCERNIGYDGMIFREVAERALKDSDSLKLNYTRVVFIGFNALTKTEETIFNICQAREIGDYYFDYSSPEINKDGIISGHFIAENKKFKSQFDINEHIDLGARNIQLYSISSNIGQAKQVGQIVRDLQKEGNVGTNTAVILPNEGLLFPTLQALPAETPLNITMGYPIMCTPLVALIEQIAAMQKKLVKNGNAKAFYHKFVEKIILHPYLISYEQKYKQAEEKYTLQQLYNDIINEKRIIIAPEYFEESKRGTAADKLIKRIFRVVENSTDFIVYLRQIIELLQDNCDINSIDNRYCQSVIEALNLIEKCETDFDEKIGNISTAYKLFKQLISGEKASFESDIIEGLQIMGTLEARGIDFENVIITAFNEGTFPQSTVNSPSLIPYNIRRAYKLPTYEYHDAIFAYNFYRLIYRAKNVFLIYDNRTEGSSRTEPSRYALQLKHILHANVNDPIVIDNQITTTSESISIEKDANVQTQMQRFLRLPNEGEKRKNISASAINDYNACSLKFYLTHILGLREDKQLEDSVDNSLLGTIFHYVMENVYQPRDPKKPKGPKNPVVITKDFFTTWLDEHNNCTAALEKQITDAFEKNSYNKPDINGNYMLLAEVVKNYVVRTLVYDRDHNAPFTMIDTEHEITYEYDFDNGRKINVHGYIDRIHEKDGIIHIVDYKTGKKEINCQECKDLFDADKKLSHLCQVFFYSLLYKTIEKTNKAIQPHIYSPLNLSADTITLDKATVTDFAPYETDFVQQLNENIKNIFDSTQPFVQTQNEKHCEYCSFKLICNKGKES